MAKSRYTQAQVVEALTESRGLQALAATKLGCSVQTIWNYRQKYPEIDKVIAHQREGMLDMAEGQLYAAIKRGEAWAICFFLKTQGKARKYSERLEVTGADGQAVSQPQIVVVSPQARDMTQKVIAGERTLPAGAQN